MTASRPSRSGVAMPPLPDDRGPSSAGGSGLPFFSVVIPTLNSARTIDRTLQSLAGQHHRDFEVIVRDGGSTDDTLERVAAFHAALPSLSVTSEADAGVYDAINKGIAQAQGRWLHVLGSDDCLHDPSVLSDFRGLLEGSDAAFVYGDVRIVGASRIGSDGSRYCGALDWSGLLERNICQQAVFYRANLFDVLGRFEPRYRICADWAFALRAFAAHRVQWVDRVVCNFNGSGLSSRESDHAFSDDFARILLGIFRGAPFSARLAPMRWRLYREAGKLWRSGRFGYGLACWTAGAWLTVMARTGPRDAVQQ